MQAIIFANRLGDELAPLNRHYCPALLPIGNKAVIEYTLEDIAATEITQVKLITSAQAQEIAQHLGDGSRWGLEIDYFLSKDEEDTAAVLQRLSLDPNSCILLARGDIMRSPSIGQFINFSKEFPHEFVQAKMANKNAGMLLLPAARDDIAELNWPLAIPCNSCFSVTLVLHGHCFMLDNFRSYMDANLTFVANQFSLLSPVERRFPSANRSHDFYVGAQAMTGDLNKLDAWGILGEHCWIDPSVDMKHAIFVGAHSLIDKHTRLESCLVLPHTYVGQGMEVSDSIISKNLLINLKNQACIEINDHALIGANEDIEKSHTDKTSLLVRLAVLALLIISLPLWPLLTSYAITRHQYFRFKRKGLPQFSALHAWVYSDTLKDNAGVIFPAWRWNIPSRPLAILPQLYHVFCGRLDLFGASPQASHKSAQYCTRLGVLGPAQLLLNNHAPEEERHMLEIEFESNTNRTKYLTLLWQACLASNSQQATEQSEFS